jgi:uncharacterized protein YbjT (DUF2867 family)
MNVLIFGATGMVGQGVLWECLSAPDVERIVTIGRTATGIVNPKLREIVLRDMSNYADLDGELTGFDACFFCLGVSSSGMNEADYQRVTYDLTLAAAGTLCHLNTDMAFIYVSGAGTDSSEMGRVMWARIKGKTENALLHLPFHAYMFRPGLIQPMDGIVSKTRLYRAIYMLMKPLLSTLRWALPNLVLTTRDIGQAMLAVARFGYRSRILEAKDIRALVTG